jgi:hypothetical protein
MVDKLKPVLRLAGHTAFSFVAALAGASTLYALLRPLLGRERYQELAQTPLMILLLLASVSIGGAEGYRRWPVRSAFFAWALPAIVVFHLLVNRGWTGMNQKWSDPFFFFGIGAAYSVGALLAAIVIRNHQSS